MTQTAEMPEQARQQLTATNNELKAKLAFANNSDRLQRASKRGTLPYFVRDNYTVRQGRHTHPDIRQQGTDTIQRGFQGLTQGEERNTTASPEQFQGRTGQAARSDKAVRA